jgi:hypothetical protein
VVLGSAIAWSAILMQRTAVLRWICLAALLLGCHEGVSDLRGRAVPSQDARTYLVIDDDNGGGCGPILVDGTRWPHALHAPGEISPGAHTITCGGSLEIDVPAGSTYHFDYWGP